MTRTKGSDEASIQRTFHMNLIRFGGPRVLGFSVPNERKGSRISTGKLKAQGLMPGACDYIVLWHGGGALIEFKTATGRVSTSQEAFGGKASAIGWPYRVCRSWQEAFAFLEQVGAPLAKLLRCEGGERFVNAGEGKLL